MTEQPVYQLTISGRQYPAAAGQTVLEALRAAGFHPDAPCGGKGKCGKCKVLIDGQEQLSCQTVVDRDMTVVLPEAADGRILTAGRGIHVQPDGDHDYALAIDIGTTTVVAFLLDGHSGALLSTASMLNPQTSFGADVISRIQYVMDTGSSDLKDCIRAALAELTHETAARAGIAPEKITVAAIVGNTAMHHLLLGIDPKPLTIPPYMPAVSHAITCPPEGLLPIAPDGEVRVLPNIAGFVGADTVGCLLSTEFDRLEKLTLMIDIGTNGEMVLGNRRRRIACSTAAGPAFEGAKIFCGMRGAEGAIDHVRVENGQPVCSVIGGGTAAGICGSGLLDAVRTLLELEFVTPSGRMDDSMGDPALWTTADGCKALRLSGDVVLTQKDVREVQLAKGAIRAGIELMARQYGVRTDEIETVYLAGAFGNYLDPASACAIGMIPPCLLEKIVPIGNAAGDGAKMAALSKEDMARGCRMAEETEFLELASLPEFQDCYVDCLSFEEEEDDDE